MPTGFLRIVFAIPSLLFIVLITADVVAQNQFIDLYAIEFNELAGDISNPDALPDSDLLAGKNWHPVSLPHYWQHKHSDQSASRWYRLHFDLKVTPRKTWSVYIPRAIMNAAVYLNGKLIGQEGSMSAPLTRHWNKPYLFTVPVSMLEPRNNSLMIRLAAEPYSTGLIGRVYIGPQEKLVGLYKSRIRYQVSSAVLFSNMMLFVSGFFLVLWMFRKQDQIYFWGALAVFSWALSLLQLYIMEPLINEKFNQWFKVMVIYLAVLLTYVFLSRLINLNRPVAEKRLCYLGGFIAVFFAAVPPALREKSFVFFLVVVLLIGAGIGYRLTLSFYRSHRWQLALILASFVIELLLVLHDGLLHLGIIVLTDIHLFQYGVPVMLIVFSIIMISYYVSSLSEVETLNASLEKRIADKVDELELKFTQLKNSEHARVLAEERTRIMRDIHDGFGGQLVSAIALLVDQSDEKSITVRQLVQTALDDLRIMIDSLSQDDADLPALLGMFRSRIMSRFEQAGITLNWQVDKLPSIRHFGPERALQVLRILQEAVTNIVKHANAKTITLEAGYREAGNGPGKILIRVSDDGVGFDCETPKPGFGLENMRYRAGKIDAALDLKSDQTNGTRLSLLISV